ncbi:cation diffusion facilitator family transporter [Leptonema illini]|jgi:cobalt-zinc-cadmium efflux system protein|uniref:Cation diffusion facilitator family transporter n=1 Tax=Leptonema illini DSM 21528 TaxID=929563 RepID=H2CBL3_9LEPT|nr:cation diffusion facilitator family transporter [Leptonema illini]EHQ07388.1 cation diffusion facilitator family transporter [Leptonema illini DSM 21528]
MHHHGEISGRRLLWVTLINLVITIAEVIGGIVTGSIALLSDSAHNLSDTISIVLSYVALRIALRTATPRRSYGYKRAEILAAFLNSLFLLLISAYLIYEAIARFYRPEPIKGDWMLIVAVIGLVGNLVCVMLLHQHANHSLNIRSGYLHLLADTLSSVGVVIGAVILIFFPTLTWIDPVVSLLISFYIIKESKDIFLRTVDILMQSSAELDYEEMKRSVEAIDGVQNIHHVHTWLANERTIHFEAHIELEDMLLSQTAAIRERIQRLLEDQFGVSHITLQFECRCCAERTIYVKEPTPVHHHDHSRCAHG